MSLTKIQRRYIWLAGSFPKLAIKQGAGYRCTRTMYRVDDRAGTITLFGYADPIYFLKRRGLFCEPKPGRYALTDAGKAAFEKLKANGGVLSYELREVK